MINKAKSVDFGAQLRRYRKRRNLTQNSLSGLSTISVRALRNLEQGQVAFPRRETVRLLADALRLTASERVSFNIAAGCEPDDSLFDTLVLQSVASIPPLHGRKSEVEALLKQVLSGRTRLASISGFGGVGKTLLAARTSQLLLSRHDIPAIWVSLKNGNGETSSLGMADLLSRDLLSATQTPHPHGDDALDNLSRTIGDRAALLVVDGNDSSQIPRQRMRSMLRDCPRLRIIETSRMPKSGAGEYQLALYPLPTLPADAGLDEMRAAPALALMHERVAEHQPGFELTDAAVPAFTEICYRLDGLPRSLEAAASWLSIISLEELVAMARSEPHLFAARPGEEDDMTTAVREVVGVQPKPDRDLLIHLAGWPDSWTVDRVVTSVGVPKPQVARAVQAFLRFGLIMKVTARADRLVHFTVLNTVRTLLREHPELTLPTCQLTGPACGVALS